MSEDANIVCILSFDIEEWFHENINEFFPIDEWQNQESRVVNNVEQLLIYFEEKNIKATFFVLGWIAENYPDLVKKIYAKGHEIASHGYGHKLIYSLSKNEFREDIKKSKVIIEEIIEDQVIGYRAPSFSITDWAIDILKEEGFLYDSSYFPTFYHLRYGKIDIHNYSEKQNILKLRDNFYEIILSSLNIMGLKIPWSGGGYFRFIPYPIFYFGVKKIFKVQKNFVFYLHPWEIDPFRPKINNLKFSYKIRRYTGLKKTDKKLRKFLGDFKFTSISEYLKSKKYL